MFDPTFMRNLFLTQGPDTFALGKAIIDNPEAVALKFADAGVPPPASPPPDMRNDWAKFYNAPATGAPPPAPGAREPGLLDKMIGGFHLGYDVNKGPIGGFSVGWDPSRVTTPGVSPTAASAALPGGFSFGPGLATGDATESPVFAPESANYYGADALAPLVAGLSPSVAANQPGAPRVPNSTAPGALSPGAPKTAPDLLKSLSGVKAPPAPAVQSIRSPPPYSPKAIPQDVPFAALLAQMVGGQKGSIADILRLAQAVGGR